MASPQLPGTMIVDGAQADPWEQAFGAYRQALLDLNGDGVPDVAVPTAQSVRPSDRARMRQAGSAPVQEPAGAGQLAERWTEAATRRIPAAVMGAADPMGIPSYGVGLVSPGAGQWMRDVQAADPSASMVGGLATPIAGKVGGAIVKAARLNPMLTGGAIVGATVATPSEAGQETPYDQQMRAMTEQQAALRQSAEKLQNERRALIEAADIESKSGRGKNWQAKQQAVTEWDRQNGQLLTQQNAQLSALDERMRAYESEYGPAAVRKRSAEMPTKELFPNAIFGTQAALAAAGLGTSMLMKGRNIGRFNSAIDDLSTGLSNANTAGRTAEATALATKLGDIVKKGPSSAGTVAPTVAGFELGAFAPTAADYYRSGGDPTSPLYKKAVGSMTGADKANAFGYEIPIPDIAARAAMAGLLGYGASKIGTRAVEGIRGVRSPPHTAMIQAEVNGRATGGAPDSIGVRTNGQGVGGQQVLPPEVPESIPLTTYSRYEQLPSSVTNPVQEAYLAWRAIKGGDLPPKRTANAIGQSLLDQGTKVPVSGKRINATNESYNSFVAANGRPPTRAEFDQIFNRYTLAIPAAVGASALNPMLQAYYGD